MIEGKVELTLSQVDFLRKEAQDAKTEVTKRDEIIRGLEDNQRKVILNKVDYQLVYTGDVFINEGFEKKHSPSLNIRTKTGILHVSPWDASMFADQLIKLKYLQVVGKDNKSYVNFEDVKEELRFELEAKIEKKYQQEISESRAKYTTLNDRIALIKNEHEVHVEKLNHEHAVAYHQLKEEYILLKEGKEKEDIVSSLKKEIEHLQDVINNSKTFHRPWWKFWA